MGQNQSEESYDGPGIKLRLLSWNIDGLDGKDVRQRTESVIQLIQSRRPHIIFLQEVIPPTLSQIRNKLGSNYSIHISPKISFQYFPIILVTKKCPKITIDGEVGMFDFPGSTMGRQLLQLFIKICGVPFALYTSHLESMKDYSRERKEQLRSCFEFVTEQTSLFNRVCILGGDLNIRDNEVAEVGMPPSVVDIWETCGSVEEHKYTWDISKNDNLFWRFPNKPRLRFDRLYLSPGRGEYVKPLSFELVGKERISGCNRFPSDHWGLWTELQVSELVVLD